jgi:DNA polymerase-3 subunit alpha
MVAVTDVGLLKMDVLGLRTLTVMKNALKLIEQSRGETLDLEDILFDDARTFDLLGRGETAGVFQLESSGMRQVVTEMKPDALEDIIALVALFRPGPMARIPDYIAGKHGTKKITYLHPALQPILEETYGVIVYQEQVMEIARQLAGFSMSSAETVLYAMRKKKHEDMARLRDEFLDGAVQNGVQRKVADEIWTQMAEFAGYGFNKAHAASYAINAYQTAYLKAHYPAEFMAAQLTSIMDNKDKVALYVQECRRMGIEVLPPDVNASEPGFTVEDGKIRFGLAGVKHVSRGAVEALAAERQANGPFQDLHEMCSRLEPGKLNKMALESLARAGAMTSLGATRSQLVAALDQALDWGARVYRDREAGQTSLFGVAEGQDTLQPTSPPLPPASEFAHSDLLAMEKERLGAYLSGHPLSAVRDKMAAVTTATAAEVAEGSKEGALILAGIITSYRKRVTRTGKVMAHFTLEDLSGVIEVTLLPEPYERCGASLVEQAIVAVRGRPELDERWGEDREGGGQHRLLADAVVSLDDREALARLRNGANSRNGPRSRRSKPASPASRPPTPSATPRRPRRSGSSNRVHIRVPPEAPPDAVGRLKAVIGQFHGDSEVLLHIHMGEQERRLRLGLGHTVSGDPRFTQAVRELFGDDAIWLE